MDLTIGASGIGETDRLRIVRVAVNVSGAESYTTTIDGAALRSGDLHVQYIPGVSSGSLSFVVDALDSNGTAIANGMAEDVALVPGDAVQVVLDLMSPLADLGSSDLAIEDGGVADLTVPIDLESAECAGTTVSTLAGNGTAGAIDGTGGPAGTTEFKGPLGIAVDNTGNVYVADSGNSRIRRVAPDGTTTTIALDQDSGTSDVFGASYVAVDAAGTLYIADTYHHQIRKIPAGGVAVVLAGNGTAGFNDGPGGSAEFNFPAGVAVDGNGYVYVGDNTNNRIRKIATDGTTSSLAGNGTAGFADGSSGIAEFNAPAGVAVDSQGVVYVADYGNNRIRRVAPDGTTTTIAGNGTAGFKDGSGGANGTTMFKGPTAVDLYADGSMYVTDNANSRIRKILPDGTTTTIAGTSVGFADGNGCTSLFNQPAGIAGSGTTLFVTDAASNRLRKIQIP
ncbi:MAG TPA: SMP-30/gluconolactonase/LRE family protein [Polyangia bacterium]